MDCSNHTYVGGCGTPPNFTEKTFTDPDGSQTLKSVKVFSLESFLLYGIRREQGL